MSGTKEKISFLYPSLVGEGDRGNAPPPPDLVITGVILGKSYPFVVTAGFIFDESTKYVTSLDIFYDGESVLDPEFSDYNKMDTLMFSRSIPEQNIVLASMFLAGVKLEKPGMYTVVLDLHEGPDLDVLTRDVDKKECFFIVPPSREEK
ncbi:hypothetical protein [Serratia sarumanii]|uniref:hypothetical protein n=1 Tax=Serratia sarumanii TaxID=3020826 RepID=UPI003F7DAA27